MGTVNSDLQSALNARLTILSPALPVVWENTVYSPTTGSPYLQAWLLPAEARIASLGVDGFNEYRGIFQIDCIFPAGDGWGPAKAQADLICSHFFRGLRLSQNGLSILIEKSWPGPGTNDAGWYKVPVSVVYSVYAQ